MNGNRPKGKQRQFKLFDWEIRLLDQIAEVRNVRRGGTPNRSGMVRLLIEEEAERLNLPRPNSTSAPK